MTASRIQRVLLLSNAFGGATMAAYCWLRDRGIRTAFQPAGSASAMIAADLQYGPDLLFAPTLTARVPDELLGRVVINHPGRIGDRGASSIDWGRYRRERFGGTTLLLAAEGWDTGDVVYTATYPYPAEPATKSWIYSHLNRAAMLRGLEHLTGGRTTGRPSARLRPRRRPREVERPDAPGRLHASTGRCRRRRSCGGRPPATVRPVCGRELLGRAVHLYDVHVAGPTRADEGQVVGWIADAAIRVAVGPRDGDGLRESVWIGFVKPCH